jgi:hypothetical protein
MEKKIFEILEKMKLEVITLDEAQRQLCFLFGVIKTVCSCDKPKQRALDVGSNKCSHCCGIIE